MCRVQLEKCSCARIPVHTCQISIFCLHYVAVQIGVKIASVVQLTHNHDGKLGQSTYTGSFPFLSEWGLLSAYI